MKNDPSISVSVVILFVYKFGEKMSNIINSISLLLPWKQMVMKYSFWNPFRWLLYQLNILFDTFSICCFFIDFITGDRKCDVCIVSPFDIVNNISVVIDEQFRFISGIVKSYFPLLSKSIDRVLFNGALNMCSTCSFKDTEARIQSFKNWPK